MGETVDDFFGTPEASGETDTFVVLGVVWVTKSYVFSDLLWNVNGQELNTCAWRHTYGEREVSVVLEEERHCFSEIDQSEGLDVFPVDKDFTFGGVVDSGDELQNGTFTRTVGSNNDL